MSTVRPRVMKLPARDPGRQGEVRNIDFEFAADNLPRIIEFRTEPLPKTNVGKVLRRLLRDQSAEKDPR
jgi:long-chain acyl-CoA synthetase